MGRAVCRIDTFKWRVRVTGRPRHPQTSPAAAPARRSAGRQRPQGLCLTRGYFYFALTAPIGLVDKTAVVSDKRDIAGGSTDAAYDAERSPGCGAGALPRLSGLVAPFPRDVRPCHPRHRDWDGD